LEKNRDTGDHKHKEKGRELTTEPRIYFRVASRYRCNLLVAHLGDSRVETMSTLFHRRQEGLAVDPSHGECQAVVFEVSAEFRCISGRVWIRGHERTQARNPILLRRPSHQ